MTFIETLKTQPPMRFPVSHHLRQPIGFQIEYELQEPLLHLDDDAVLSNLQGRMRLLRTDRGLLVSVVATCTVGARCSRCLSDTGYALRLEFQEEYLPTVDALTGLALPIPEGADNFLIGADFVLDLAEALRQYKVIGEPAKPLCRPDCRGLCPNCGLNLNQGPCRCPPQKDSRWEALSKLAKSRKR